MIRKEIFKIYYDVYKTLGNKIRDIRISKKISLEELATKSNISHVFLGNIERNERRPSIDTLVKISNALKIGLYDLIGTDVYLNPSPYKHILLRNIEAFLYEKSEDELKKIWSIVKNI